MIGFVATKATLFGFKLCNSDNKIFLPSFKSNSFVIFDLLERSAMTPQSVLRCCTLRWPFLRCGTIRSFRGLYAF